jgi:hypothetical protein
VSVPQDDDLWLLYEEALAQALLLPDLTSLLVSSRAIPLYLYTATTSVPAVPVRQALDQVFSYGDAVPGWEAPYRPRADGTLVGLYRSFTASIKRNKAPIVVRAAAALAELDRQLAAGAGDLVMTAVAGSRRVVLPRYDPAPLGTPGFSGWLEFAITTYGRLPPAIDLRVDGATRPLRRLTATAERAPFLEIPGVAREDVRSLRLTIHSLTTVAITPGGWLDPSLLRSFVQPSDFKPRSVFASQPIWGPRGTLGVLAVGLAAGFRPVVEVEVGTASAVLAKADRLAVGPFRFRADPDQSGLGSSRRRFSESSLTPSLLSVSCDRPNRDL